jgi:uncharacterized protein
MKKLLLSALAFTITFTAIPAAAQTKKSENSLLWEISGNGLTNPSYLYGTFHMVCEKDFSISEKVKTAMQKCDELSLEIDFDNPKELEKMQKSGVAAKPLSVTLTEQEYVRLNEVLNTNGLNIKDYENYTLSMISSAFMFKSLGCENFKMYEIEFAKLAKKRKLPINGLETITDQLNAIKNSSTNLELINQMQFYTANFFTENVAHYNSENIDKLYTSINNQNFITDKGLELLLYNRNKKWIPTMINMMKNKSVFFAVGAAHLPQESGVINLLTEKGYIVKPILN